MRVYPCFKQAFCFLLISLYTPNMLAQIDWEIWNSASESFNSKNYTAALKYYALVEADNPFYANTYVRKGYAYYYLKDFDNALQEVERAYYIKPLDSKYFYMKGQFLDKKGDMEKALFYFDLLLKFDPNNSRYVNYRGNIHLELHNFKKAISDYNFVLARDPNRYELYFSRGAAKFNLKMKRDACLDWLYAKENNKSCNNYFHYKCTKEDLRPIKHPKFPVIDIEKPVFVMDNDSSFFNHICFELNYPREAFLNQIEGTVLVEYEINREGQFTNSKVIHSISKELDEEALRVVNGSKPYWVSPGLKNGEPINTVHIQPVNFKIDQFEYTEQQLFDSLKVHRNSGNHKCLAKVTGSILQRNPFNYEVYLIYKEALSKLQLPDTCNYSGLYQQLRSKDLYINNEASPYRKDVKLYYNNNWELTSKERAHYYRLATVVYGKRVEGPYSDYTIDGQLYSNGCFELAKKHGTFQFYYPNGQLKSEFLFDNGTPVGLWKFYHSNGQLHHLIEVDADHFEVAASFDSNANVLLEKGNGAWSFSIPMYNQVDSLKIMGEYIDNQRAGDWKISLTSGLELTERYKKGSFKSGFYMENGSSVEVDKPQIKTILLFPGGAVRSHKLMIDPLMDEDLYSKLFDSQVIRVRSMD